MAPSQSRGARGAEREQERSTPFDTWSRELQAALEAPFAPDEIKWLEKKDKKGGGRTTRIPFVSWDAYVHRLNRLVGTDGWTMPEPRVAEIGGKVVLTIGLTILGITRWNVGDEEEDMVGYGTPSTNAFAQALKRAAALFGIGLYLYDKDNRNALLGGGGNNSGGGWRGNQQGGQSTRTSTPRASDEELRALRDLARNPEIDDKTRSSLEAKLKEDSTVENVRDLTQRIRNYIRDLREQKGGQGNGNGGGEAHQGEMLPTGAGQHQGGGGRRTPQAEGR